MSNGINDNTDMDQSGFGWKIKKVIESDIHQDNHQLCEKVALYVKAIGLRER